VPEFDGEPTEKVVEPHPLFDAVNEPSTKFGSTTSIVSATPSATLSEKESDRAEGAAVTAFAIVKLLCLNVGVGGTTAGEVIMVVELMSLELAKVNATVRVAKLAACA
jgi:hypothetical protein